MKKIVLFLITLCMVVGCACTKDKASDAVKEYLNKYNNQHEKVLAELDNVIKDEEFDEDTSEKYKNVMTKQYKDLSYKIVEENYNGEEATVKTKITVYDLYSAQKEAEEYKNNHKNEFMDVDGNYEAKKFLNYKLDQMKKTTKTVEYTIDFKVLKKDGKWVLDTVSTEMLEKIDNQKKEIEDTKNKLEESKSELQAAKSSKQAKTNELKQTKDEKNKKVAQLSSEEKQVQEQLQELQDYNAKISSEIKAAEERYKKQLEELKKQEEQNNGGSTGGSINTGKGTFIKPVNSGTITAGWRYSSGALHAAVDYGVPVGTPVYASAAGVVIKTASLNYSYGTYVVIQHTNGMQTWYAHGSALKVSQGQTVSQGQVIAKMGSTGNSTGNHLHLEVRVNGSSVNPQKYLY